MQETSGIGRKAEGLRSRVTFLEEQFDTPPGNVAEQDHRAEVIRYGIIPFAVPGAELLPASLSSLKFSCSACLRNPNHSNLLIPLNTRSFLGSLRTCERSSSSIRFVHDAGAILCVDEDGRHGNKCQYMRKDVG